MNTASWQQIEQAKKAALNVLLHNAHGPYCGLPRTAGWGYPEPYTRDLMISILGIAVSKNLELLESIRKVLITLAENQTQRGHISSLVHDSQNRGSSDTTPLFLLGVAIFRKVTGEMDFLRGSVDKALTWMAYQSPSDRYLIGQQPTSDWRDEQWTTGYGLFVNALTYSYLMLLGEKEQAALLCKEINKSTLTGGTIPPNTFEGFAIPNKPWYAFWTYKIHSNERFDLLGNSIAILSGIASASRAEEMIAWLENECVTMRMNNELNVDLPPNFFPFIMPADPDWQTRYDLFNMPGNYHNGGIWPFVCGFYVAALVAANQPILAEQKLIELTRLVKLTRAEKVTFGFNEWIKAQDGKPMGQDWQTWSAAMYLYAAKCVEEKRTPFFEEMRI